ncbi:MAG: hypothetical protein ACREFH_04260 [Stellaceae bacterium]
MTAMPRIAENAPLLLEAREAVLNLLHDHGSLDAAALGPLMDVARSRFGAGASDPIPI